MELTCIVETCSLHRREPKFDERGPVIQHATGQEAKFIASEKKTIIETTSYFKRYGLRLTEMCVYIAKTDWLMVFRDLIAPSRVNHAKRM